MKKNCVSSLFSFWFNFLSSGTKIKRINANNYHVHIPLCGIEGIDFNLEIKNKNEIILKDWFYYGVLAWHFEKKEVQRVINKACKLYGLTNNPDKHELFLRTTKKNFVKDFEKFINALLYIIKNDELKI